MAQPAARQWTDATGRVITAEFVRADGSNVTIRMDGKEFTLPLEKLSDADRKWVAGQGAPPANPSAPPAPSGEGGALVIAGQTVKPGGKIEFETPLGEELKARAGKLTKSFDEYKEADMSRALVGLFVPEGFDPAKSWPIMVVSVTNSGRDQGKEPSSVKAMGGFIDAARDLGWIVIAADCPGYKTPGLPFNRCALAEAALDALAAQWPGSKEWPVATGGFSGGAKYSGWLGGWLRERGRRVTGMFMGGCNEDMATLALNELKPPRKEFTGARVFVSTGREDKIAGPGKTASVISSLKDSGFEVREELSDGAHQLNRAHVAEAMGWFAQAR